MTFHLHSYKFCGINVVEVQFSPLITGEIKVLFLLRRSTALHNFQANFRFEFLNLI